MHIHMPPPDTGNSTYFLRAAVSPVDKGISTYFLHATLLCVPADTFDLSSWIVRNWDWRETCSLKRLTDRPIGVWEGKFFSRVWVRPHDAMKGPPPVPQFFAGFWVFKNDPKLNWMKATICSSIETGLFSNNCFLLYIIMCSTLGTKHYCSYCLQLYQGTDFIMGIFKKVRWNFSHYLFLRTSPGNCFHQTSETVVRKSSNCAAIQISGKIKKIQ